MIYQTEKEEEQRGKKICSNSATVAAVAADFSNI